MCTYIIVIKLNQLHYESQKRVIYVLVKYPDLLHTNSTAVFRIDILVVFSMVNKNI